MDLAAQAAAAVPQEARIFAGGYHRMVDHRYLDYLCDIKEAIPVLPSAEFARHSALLEAGLFDERLDQEED